MREELRTNWRERLKELNKKQGKDRSELLFGNGGKYSIEDLRTRLNMLEALSAMLRLLHHYLQALMEHLIQREG